MNAHKLQRCHELVTKCFQADTQSERNCEIPGGRSLYSDDRDDRRIFFLGGGCNRRFSIFRG